MFPLAHGETVVRERRRLVLDPYSNEETRADWSEPDELEIEGVAIAPGTSTETRTENRTTISSGMSLYCSPGMDVKPDDRIRARSGLWEVDGEVADWRNALTGWNPGAEFSLKKVEG